MSKIRIFDSPWHLGHQYEMLKFPFAEFSWLFNHRRDFSVGPRGDLTKMFKWVYDYEPGKYDVAILHLDQQCMEWGILERGKGSVYQHLNEVIKDIPKIVIMHGTPYYPEILTDLGPFRCQEDIVKKVKEMVGDNYMVVNSHTAAKQWGFGKTIIHGMDANEWWDMPKEPRVVTMLSQGGFDAYYDRPFLEYTREALAEKDIIHCHITVDFQARDWKEYREFLGRSLIYFNPTRESPMPRSRTEAMLSGCCVLTTPYQDADTFIKDGENGFIVPRDPQFVADLCEELINNPERAIKIGQAGKKTAQELFSWNRYAKEWEEFLNFVINDFKSKKKL
jgi:glycosyltransferase involved in cell wall biosynthesis